MPNPESICRSTYQIDERVHMEDGGDKLVFESGATLEVKAGATVTGISGSGSPGGEDTQVQFNDGGAFGGDAGLTFNKSTPFLGIIATTTIDGNLLDRALYVRGFGASATGIRSRWEQIGANESGTAIEAIVYTSTADNANSLIGLFALIDHHGSGNITNAITIDISSPVVDAGGTISTYTALNLEASAAIANSNIGLKIGNYGTAPNDYAIKVDGGNSDFGPNTTSVGQLRVTAPAVPASAGASGVAGEVAWASGFVYICVATNTWQRAALTTW